ncbi:hypothetical protein [Candidimonas nitroreducens]|uniref:Uncharacterized protein n=1 Tax=Candidimonas nitroreducens TaxID=683354 RepID=A0A225M694_9BURK|nr:hypothetical protein [Candidimonas nitroreducens]OWT55630.1 hypothetical protein CEY11_20080 [Candidimonas nitroreducens]
MSQNQDNAIEGTPFPGGNDGLEHRLDDALDDTFPASDPVQLVGRSSRRDTAARRPAASGEQGPLDEGLEETFPASDPVSIDTPESDGP